ncbi:MAG: hypothetical protein J2P48_13290, partial [Alphaproteobacteria bacterium]|nr:hypothetical protein [Alphaproteobacteria bacterium]
GHAGTGLQPSALGHCVICDRLFGLEKATSRVETAGAAKDLGQLYTPATTRYYNCPTPRPKRLRRGLRREVKWDKHIWLENDSRDAAGSPSRYA